MKAEGLALERCTGRSFSWGAAFSTAVLFLEAEVEEGFFAVFFPEGLFGLVFVVILCL